MNYNLKAFNTKETYLTFRQEWKDEYKQLSKDIRANKLNVKNVQRGNENDGSGWEWDLEKRKAQATQMLEFLAEAKQNAQASYLYFKDQSIAA